MTELSLELAKALKEAGFPQGRTMLHYHNGGNYVLIQRAIFENNFKIIASCPNSDELEVQIEKEFGKLHRHCFMNGDIRVEFKNNAGVEYNWIIDANSTIECWAKLYIELKNLYEGTLYGGN